MQNTAPKNTPALKNSFEAPNEEKVKELEERYKSINSKHITFSQEKSLAKKSTFGFGALIYGAGKKDVFEKTAPHELYKNGKCTYDEALHKLNTMEKTSDITYNLLVNIATSLIATSTGIAIKGKFKLSLPVITAIGAGVGAVIKTGINFIDRYKNGVEGDEFDPKLLLKDVVTGGVNGLFSGMNAGFGKEFNSASILKKICFEAGKQGVMIGGAKILTNQQNKKE